ncbi:MAG: hypothetical protein O7F12_03435 [Nitrospirae bacterium]|nr:hypothetical protein [Nitrospirota bacterium]
MLITIFIDLQFEWVKNTYQVLLILILFFLLGRDLKSNFILIATVVFATFFFVTLVQSTPSLANNSFRFTKPFPVPKNSSLPRLIHIILDEHIGIDGIPTGISGGKALQENLIDFYHTYGFRLFPSAFSHYFQTYDSIPSLLNFSADNDQQTNILPNISGKNHTLLRNTYFEILAKTGYHINVLAPQFIDYCVHSPTPIHNCYTYNSFEMKAVIDLEITVSQKVGLLLSRYFSESYLKNFIVKKHYQNMRVVGTKLFGISLPPWSWESSESSLRMHSINTMHILNNLGESILAIPPGNAFFVHLLFPHYPYIAHADCSIIDPMAWKDRYIDKTNPRVGNTVESRKVRYQLYFDQLSCLYSRLDELFKQMQASRIYDDSIIIIHGDHGSRISIREPLVSNRDVLTDEDIIDGFSTLFAVKMPGKAWDYDSSPLPLEQLMADVATELTGVSQTFGQDRPAKFVYLQDKKKLLPFPFPGAQ